MKKLLIKIFLVLAVSALLGFTATALYKTILKNAYNDGVFFGYAEGYLKHKHYPESNEFFVYDEKILDYVSVQTKVYLTEDKIYHRKDCASHSETAAIKDVFKEYSPCASCKPPIVMQ